jgi:hypothetical protein
MRILDLFKGHTFAAPKALELDERGAENWPQQLVTHFGIDREFAGFAAAVESAKQATAQSLRPFTDEDTLSAVPERARTMSALHGHEFASQTNKLLAAATFTDLFLFEKQQDGYFEANSAYKGLTAKNIAALREFFSDELKATQTHLQALEDIVIKFTGVLEEHKFPQVRKIKEMQLRISQAKERAERYRQLLTSLEQDLAKTKEKREKLETEMRTQFAFIRNEQALVALQRSERIERELHDIAALYVSVCDDLRNIYKRHHQMKMSPKLKHVVDELPKDPLVLIAEESDGVRTAFEEAIAQLEEENPGNVKNVIVRLSKLAKEAEGAGRKVSTSVPDQRALKRDIMKDIAALQCYDKQQFLLRAKTEEEAVTTKIAFIKAELDPDKLAAMGEEMKALARDLGARIKGEPEAAEEDTEKRRDTEESARAEEKEKNEEKKTEETVKKEQNPKDDIIVEEQHNEEKQKTTDKERRKKK